MICARTREVIEVNNICTHCDEQVGFYCRRWFLHKIVQNSQNSRSTRANNHVYYLSIFFLLNGIHKRYMVEELFMIYSYV